MQVSFFQFLPKFNKISENLDSIKKLINDNSKVIKKSELVVFPEYFLSGPQTMDTYKNEYVNIIKNLDLKAEFKAISKRFSNTVFVFGTILDGESKQVKNISYVYKNGKIISEYSKKALIYNETYICSSDARYPVFEVNGKKVGVAICWDTILPEVFRKYAGKADLVVIPSFWGIGGNALQAQYKFSLEKKYYRALLTTRAYENAFTVLFVNSVGKYSSPHYSDRLMGGSLAVVPPQGEVFFTNNKKPEALHSVEIDFGELEKYREFYATDKDYEYYKTKKIF
jgi:predicted amidohydrolase